LIDYGAVCNAKTPDKVTALRIAAGHEDSEVFDKLSAAAEKEAPELDDLPQ
jgi:ankyrin repeat protein